MRKHIVLGDMVNASLVSLAEGNIVIDTSVGLEGAQELLLTANKYGETLFVVNTHEHSDHVAGNKLFRCPIICSTPTRAALRAKRIVPLPAIAFSEELELYLGEHILLKHFGGHSLGSAVVCFPERKLLFTGDLIFAGRVPYMGEADFHRWLLALEIMEKWDVDTVVPGHGAPGGKELLARQRQWLEDYIQDVREWIRQGLALEEMLVRFLRRFPGVENWKEMLLRSFALIQEQFD